MDLRDEQRPGRSVTANTGVADSLRSHMEMTTC
jgi:hypothetical protein